MTPNVAGSDILVRRPGLVGGQHRGSTRDSASCQAIHCTVLLGKGPAGACGPHGCHQITSKLNPSTRFADRSLRARAMRLDQSTANSIIFDIGDCGPPQRPKSKAWAWPRLLIVRYSAVAEPLESLSHEQPRHLLDEPLISGSWSGQLDVLDLKLGESVRRQKAPRRPTSSRMACRAPIVRRRQFRLRRSSYHEQASRQSRVRSRIAPGVSRRFSHHAWTSSSDRKSSIVAQVKPMSRHQSRAGTAK